MSKIIYWRFSTRVNPLVRGNRREAQRCAPALSPFFLYWNRHFLDPKIKKNRCKPARRERAAAAGLRALEGFAAETLRGRKPGALPVRFRNTKSNFPGRGCCLGIICRYSQTPILFFWHRWRILLKLLWRGDPPLKYRGGLCEKQVPRKKCARGLKN